MNIENRDQTSTTKRRHLRPLHFERTTVELAFDRFIDFDRLDSLIEQCFAVRLPILSALSENGPEEEQVRAWLDRCLYIWGEILRAACLPVFDRGWTSGLIWNPQSGKWKASLLTPVLFGYDEAITRRALKAAMETMQRMATSVADCEPPHSAWVARFHVKPLMQMMGSAKSMTIPLMRCAFDNDIPVRHIAGGAFMLGWGSEARFMQTSIMDGDSVIGARLSGNKAHTATLLKQAGFPAMPQTVVTTVDAALKAAQETGFPVVVKPVDLDRGEGVFINLTSVDEVSKAAEKALWLSPARLAVVEPMMKGVCHRLVMVNGQLLYAVKRWPKSVVGDGAKSVEELVVAANAANDLLPPWSRDTRWPLDALAVGAMEAGGFSPSCVPPAGSRVPLRQIESTIDGGLDEDVTQRIHPSILDMAKRVARLFRLTVIGIDILTDDISIPADKSGAVINEVNFAPTMGLAAISRSYLPGFFGLLDTKPSRIPVEVVLGAGGKVSRDTAHRRQQALMAGGYAGTYVVSADKILGPLGGPDAASFATSAADLPGKLAALSLDTAVEALVIVISRPEDILAPWPIDKITAFHDSRESWGKGTRAVASRQMAVDRLMAAVSRETGQGKAPA